MNYENESWSGKMPNIALKKDNANYNEFFKTMLERQLIWKRRFIDKLPMPWTTDEIFKTGKFTNVYRSLDKNSMWEIEHIILDDTLDLRNLVWKTLFFRLFNNPATFESNAATQIEYRNGIPSLEEFDKDEWLSYLKRFRHYGNNPFTSAYLISSVGDRDTHFACTVLPEFHKRIDELIERCRKAYDAQSLFKYLKTFTNVADFMAFQLFMDLTYIDKFTDRNFMRVTEDSATTIGPGSGLGLRLIYPSAQTQYEQLTKLKTLRDESQQWFDEHREYGDFPYLHFNKANKQFYISDEWNITLSEIEQWLCEYAKYWKMKIGEGKQRQRFNPVTKGFKTLGDNIVIQDDFKMPALF